MTPKTSLVNFMTFLYKHSVVNDWLTGKILSMNLKGMIGSHAK